MTPLIPVVLADASPLSSLWQQVQAHYGLSQLALGQLLGLSPSLMNHVVTGRRSLPLAAAPAWTRLVLALGPATPPPADLPPPVDIPAPAFPAAHPLAQHGRACVVAAQRLAQQLAAAQARAAWAERRLAALPQLAAPLLPTDTAPPAWLIQFASEARVALAEAGPTVQARLALRRAGLLHEAALAQRLLAGAALADLVEEPAVIALSHIFNPLPTLPLRAFSVTRFTTKAQCQAYLDKKAPERILLTAHLSTVQAELATWDQKGNPAADQATAQSLIDNLTPILAATTDPKEQLKLERLINSYRSRVTNLGGRADTHGTDELLDREQDRDDDVSSLDILDNLLAAVTAHRDALRA